MNNNVSNNSEGIVLDLPWSSNNTIIGNHVWNNSYGINLDQPPNNYITNNNVSYNFIGIYLQSSSNNTIMDNIIFNNGDGIRLTSSFDNYISGNNVSRHPNSGIYLDQSSNTTLKGNYVLDNFYGIKLKSSPYCNIIGNNITSGNTYSIYALESSFSNLSENEVSNNNRGIELHSSSNCTINDNICLLNEGNSIMLSFSSNNNTITANNVLNSNAGIALLDGAINNHVADNNASYNRYGIFLFGVSQNTVSNNTMINNGIFIRSSLLPHWNMHNIDTSNTVNGKPVYYWKNKTGGIIPADAGQVILANSTNIRIENHEFINCTVGIEVGFSLNTTIINNTVMSNIYGVYLAYSNENNITGNIVMKNERGLNLYFSDRNNIFTNIVSNNDNCILSEYSNDNNIKYNNLNNNRYDGITFFDSNGSYIILNNISSNNRYGIDLTSSSNNHVYHNNIINNKFQAYDSTNNENQWDDGYPFGGNYWSDFDEPSEGAYDDFKGTDQNVTGSDGIVDNGTIGGGGKNPYIIDSNSQDNYPLISPIGNLTFLYEGWNLISIPFIQSETNLGDVLSSIKGSYTAVQWYNTTDPNDPWKHNCTLKPPYLNDLNDVDHLMGVWIYITKPGGVLFEYFGMVPTSNLTIQLYPGWNLVGYPSLKSYNRTEGLNNLTFGTHVDAILTYNAAIQKWEKLGSSDYFKIGRGYWIHTKTSCEWEIPL